MPGRSDYAIAAEKALASAEKLAFSDADAKFVGPTHLLMAAFEQASLDKDHFCSMPGHNDYGKIFERMQSSLRASDERENQKPLRYSGDLKTVLQRARARARKLGSNTCYLEQILFILLSFNHDNPMKKMLTDAMVTPRLNDEIKAYCERFRIPQRTRRFSVPYKKQHHPHAFA